MYAWQTTLLNQIVSTLSRDYPYPEKIDSIREALESLFNDHFNSSQYEQDSGNFNKKEFSGVIDQTLKGFDPHLGFSYSEELIGKHATCIQAEGVFPWSLPETDPRFYPEEIKRADSLDLSERNSAYYDRDNGVKCGDFQPHVDIKNRFEREQREIEIPENIGYMGLYAVADPMIHQVVAEQALEVIKKMEGKDAVIIDLRGNTGGSPEGARYLLSFFLKDNTHINSIQTWTDSEWHTEEFRTHALAELSPERIPDLRNVPLYVLVDNKTFSAGEEIAYDLQQQGRSTIIGEPTKGGAHPYKTEPLIEDTSDKDSLTFNRHFTVDVPNQKAVNPISQTNWEDGEHKGVQPSRGCEVSSSEALLKAVMLAKQASIRVELQELQSDTTYESPIPSRITPKNPGEV